VVANDNGKAPSRKQRRRTKEIVEETAMLAERIKQWPTEWRQEGFKKGFKEGFKEGRKERREELLAEGHTVLIRELESRFGPLSLPPEARQRVTSLHTYKEIIELSFASTRVPTLVALGLC
jgi:flagellar biosynthesis/type III secretory pathway protein FliH